MRPKCRHCHEPFDNHSGLGPWCSDGWNAYAPEEPASEGTFYCCYCRRYCDTLTQAKANIVDAGIESMCMSCARYYLKQCGHCLGWTNRGSRVFTGGGVVRAYCPTCLNARTQACGSCGNRCDVFISPFVRWGNTNVCALCAERFSPCTTCGRLVDRECQGEYCNLCVDGGDGTEAVGVRGYHNGHPDGVVFFGDPGEVKYGIELEVNSRRMKSDSEEVIRLLGSYHVHLESDCSIGRGFEIITQPHTLNAHREMWDKFFEDVPKGLHVGPTVGLHIHIGRDYVHEKTLGKLAVFVHNPDNADFIQDLAGRTQNDYNRRHKKELNDYTHIGGDRYDAVNCTNDHTVEVRIFKSTLDRDRFFSCLEFVDALVHYCPVTRTDFSYQKLLRWLDARRETYPALVSFLIQRGYMSEPMAMAA